jgi:D-glycero-alpha-D-manno-heptose-7-phosphate kinase
MGPILNENWQLKKTLASQISDSQIDDYYQLAMQNGATGGKLLGAGGCGFLLFYCCKFQQERLRHALSDLRELDFAFDPVGTQIIHYEENTSRPIVRQRTRLLRASAA